MTNILINDTERMCVNCRSFRQYVKSPRPDALFQLGAPNAGLCEAQQKDTKATKPTCGLFVRRGAGAAL